MQRYRRRLPLKSRLFLTEGGMETDMIFNRGVELSAFAAIDLMRRPDGPEILAGYFQPYIDLARAYELGLILDTPTWRASPDWVGPIGFADQKEMGEAMRRGIAVTAGVQGAADKREAPIVLSGTVGPRGDGYDASIMMTPAEASDYHRWQMEIFEDSPVDVVSALTMTHVGEAIGIVLAAQAAELPVVVSFTVETDGRLPSGDALGDAILAVDDATGGAPLYYMINCAHPQHFERTLFGRPDADPPSWIARLGGVRANASTRSHAELDCACDLDDGDPAALGAELAALQRRLPNLTVLGGCCGTDDRHIKEIAKALSLQVAAA